MVYQLTRGNLFAKYITHGLMQNLQIFAPKKHFLPRIFASHIATLRNLQKSTLHKKYNFQWSIILKPPKIRSTGLAWSLLYIKARAQNEIISQSALDNIPAPVYRKDVVKSYLPTSIIVLFFYKLWLGIRKIVRMLSIVCTFAPVLGLYPMTYFGKKPALVWYKLLLWLMERHGPTFIKLGQWATTRRDLFSEDFCELGETLHSSVKPHSWFHTRRKLTKAYGKEWNKIFGHIIRKPVGSGCIAQVYKAYLRADMVPDLSILDEILDNDDDDEVVFGEGLEISGVGSAMDVVDNSDVTTPVVQKFEDDPDYITVAIKVLHPGVYSNVRRDLDLLKYFARFAQWMFPGLHWLGIRDCVKEFSDMMIRQVDLRYEARQMELFGEKFTDISGIRFARPIRPFCKLSVLVETFEDGLPISDFLVPAEDERAVKLKQKMASLGLDALLKMIFEDNLVHADLHPGNIRVQNSAQFTGEEETKSVMVDVGDTVFLDVKPVGSPLRLVLLDVGISSTLSTEDLRNFKDVFISIAKNDGQAVAELMLKHSKDHNCRNIESFKADISHIVSEYRNDVLCLNKVQVGELLGKVFRIMTSHKVRMESNFITILVAIFVLEGLAKSLDPDLDLLQKTKNILLNDGKNSAKNGHDLDS